MREMPFREIPGATYCTFKKGDILINEGEMVESLYYLLEGRVKRISVNDEGEKYTLELKAHSQGTMSLVGIFFAYYAPEERYSAFLFKAEEDCECYKIPMQSFRTWVRNQPAVLEELVLFFHRQSIQNSHILAARSKGNTAQEICRFLLNNAIETHDGYLVPKDRLLKDFAAVLGVHKGTVSRITKELRRRKVVERCGEGVKILDYEQLKRYAQYGIKYK